MEDKKKTLKNTLKGIGFLCIFYLGYKLIAPAFNMNDRPKMYRQVNIINADTVTLQALLEHFADSINKAPFLYSDSTTIFQNVIVIPEKTFQFNYALKIDTRKYDMPKLKKAVEKSLLDSFINIPSFKAFKDSNITVIFNFTNIKMKPLFKIEFTPDKYK